MQSVITIAYSAQNRQAEIYSYNRSPKGILLKISGSKHTKLWSGKTNPKLFYIV